MKLVLPSFAFAALSVLVASTAAEAGCSSTNVTVITGEGGSEAGPTVGDVDAEAADAGPDAITGDSAPTTGAKNPYGVAYPTAHIGWTVRSGNTPGDVIANLKLAGYAAGAGTTPTTGSLADVFDPEGRTHDMVAALLVTAWDANSSQMVIALSKALPARVALFVVLGEGNMPGAAATASDLTTWHAKYPAIASYLDPAFGQWTTVLTVAAVPFVVELDARTMEIVSAGAGASQTPKADFEAAAAAIKARQPSY
jgi:hypothetical protein